MKRYLNNILKIKYLIQLVLFAGVLFCAILPVRICLLIIAGGVLCLPCRKYWLWTSVLLSAYVFLFFSPQVMRVSGNAIGFVRRLVTPLPEVIQQSQVREPIISIVIPAYNYEKYVGQAVETAATQRFKLPYEVVVVDDGSTDDTLKQVLQVAQNYSHVAVYRQMKNRGLITTKNAGVTLARGKWIYNLDADDYLAPDALATLFSLTDKEDGGDLVFGAVQAYGAEQYIDYFCQGNNTLNYNCVPNKVLYRKSDWQKFGPYDYWFSQGVEDWDFAMAFKHADKKILMAERPAQFELIKENSRNAEANKHTHNLWWYMQAKYADMLTWQQRAEMVFCGFYRFYCEKAIARRFVNYMVLYKKTSLP